ncbi:MAG: phosphotransferase [Phototrophicales bacterium]|nr:MAG: phosphotransferase [Phototrophicales bacterium]
MDSLPFSKKGRFYKGNLHTHSTVSDGMLTPEAVCAVYQKLGYDFVAITDHFMAQFDYRIADTRALRTQTFTTLIGAELHTGRTELGNLWHILAVGLPLDFAPYPEGETGGEVCARALASGAFVAAAHPYWYILTENDILSLGDIHAIEVYNGTSADHNDKPDGWYMSDMMSMRGRLYSTCATDDAHFHDHRADVGLGWVMVKSEELSPEALLEALKRGDYYSSTGPDIYDVQRKGDRVIIQCSPADRIFITGSGWTARSAFGNGIREADLSLRGFDSPFMRITVRDAKGGRAWTSPIWL